MRRVRAALRRRGGWRQVRLPPRRALRWAHLPASRAILFRRSFPELERTLIARSHALYPHLGAEYHAGRREWTFAGGASSASGYLGADADALRYRGAGSPSWASTADALHGGRVSLPLVASAVIGRRCRSGCARQLTGRPRSRMGARAVGRVDQARPRRITGRATVVQPEGLRVPEVRRCALPCLRRREGLSDNPYLVPEYRAQLLALDPVTRAQLLEGDWDAAAIEGALFHRDWWAWLDGGTRRPCFAGAARGTSAQGRRYPRGAPRRSRVRRPPAMGGARRAHPPGPAHGVHALVKATAERDGHKTTVVVPQDLDKPGVDQAPPSRANSLGTTCAVAAHRRQLTRPPVVGAGEALAPSPSYAHRGRAFVAGTTASPTGRTTIRSTQQPTPSPCSRVALGRDRGIFGAVTPSRAPSPAGPTPTETTGEHPEAALRSVVDRVVGALCPRPAPP